MTTKYQLNENPVTDEEEDGIPMEHTTALRQVNKEIRGEEEESTACSSVGCSQQVSTVGWDVGDAQRFYCETCYINDQDESA